jgi:hypothetical protein
MGSPDTRNLNIPREASGLARVLPIAFRVFFAGGLLLMGAFAVLAWATQTVSTTLTLEGVPGGGLQGKYVVEHRFRTEDRTLAPGSIVAVEKGDRQYQEPVTNPSNPNQRTTTYRTVRYSVVVVRTRDGAIEIAHPEAGLFAREAQALSKAGTGPALTARSGGPDVAGYIAAGLLAIGGFVLWTAVRAFKRFRSPSPAPSPAPAPAAAA